MCWFRKESPLRISSTLGALKAAVLRTAHY